MARVRVYEEPTAHVKFFDGTLHQKWKIQWRDDDTDGAANPVTYEWRIVQTAWSAHGETLE
jgi:hypothetical protein